MNLIEGPTEPNYQENEIKIKPGYIHSDPNLDSPLLKSNFVQIWISGLTKLFKRAILALQFWKRLFRFGSL